MANDGAFGMWECGGKIYCKLPIRASPPLDYTLNNPKCFDDGYLSVNKLSIKIDTFVEDMYNVYKKGAVPVN